MRWALAYWLSVVIISEICNFSARRALKADKIQRSRITIG